MAKEYLGYRKLGMNIDSYINKETKKIVDLEKCRYFVVYIPTKVEKRIEIQTSMKGCSEVETHVKECWGKWKIKRGKVK